MFAILWMVSNLHASNIWSEYKFSSETALNRFDGQDFVVVLLLVLVCFDDDIIFCIPMFLNILIVFTLNSAFFFLHCFLLTFFKLIISKKLAIIHGIILDFLYGWFSGTPLYIYTIGVTGSISFLFHWMTPWVFCMVHYSHLIFRRLSAKKQLNASYLQYSFYRSYLVENNQVLCWIICSS